MDENPPSEEQELPEEITNMWQDRQEQIKIEDEKRKQTGEEVRRKACEGLKRKLGTHTNEHEL